MMESQAGFAQLERVNNRLFPTAEAMALHNESETILRCTPGSKAACVICGNAAQGIMVARSLRRGPSDFLRRRPQSRMFFDVCTGVSKEASTLGCLSNGGRAGRNAIAAGSKCWADGVAEG